VVKSSSIVPSLTRGCQSSDCCSWSYDAGTQLTELITSQRLSLTSISVATNIGPSYVTRPTLQTRSHPEMVGDMSRVTLNFDLSKIPFVRF